ncbi:MAG: TspO/MBR family protein [Chthoniobacteraceae bacterium]
MTVSKPIDQRSVGRQIVALLGFLLLTFAAPAAGVWTTSPEWYQQLARPTWSPPPGIFGPVWTALYLLMAVAAWLVWRRGGWARQRRPLTLYVVLNAAWTPVFFGLRQPGFALAIIILLWLAILATVIAFGRVQKWAMTLLLPYLAWVSFATALNFAIWRLN